MKEITLPISYFPTVPEVHAHLGGVITATPGALLYYKTDYTEHDLKALHAMKPGDTMFWGAYEMGTHVILFEAKPADPWHYYMERISRVKAVKKTFGDQTLVARRICRHTDGNFSVAEWTMDAALTLAERSLNVYNNAKAVS